jgi:para-aminobenzoate synthetase component 1
MICSKTEAIACMNNWGSESIPFLFIIDYEMQAIRLFRLDLPLPENIAYSFHAGVAFPVDGNGFIFKKYPLPFELYEKAFTSIRKYIFEGNSYLINLTFPTLLETDLTLREIYNYSHAPYKLLAEGEFVCFSPETFVTIQNGEIITKPMKGTCRANSPFAAKELMDSIKETAEHHTVVDLLRNDLSMVATDVSVRRFRYIDTIESHEGTILQVSSEISGKLPMDYRCHLGDIFFTILPAGSVTGAPKKRTTAIIREVEQSERGYYTGICGIFDGNNVDSAVMIRFIESKLGRLFFRSGGGITFMSKAREEYNELIDKVYVPIT